MLNIVAESERLILREISEADSEGFYALNRDPEVLKYTGDEPFSDVSAAHEFIRNYSHYQEYGFGRWAVDLKPEKKFIGFCGLRFDERTDEVDLGFRLMKAFWQQGIATESSNLATNVGFERYNLKSIIGCVMKNNAASHAVLKKLGFVYEKHFGQPDRLWIQYRLMRR